MQRSLHTTPHLMLCMINRNAAVTSILQLNVWSGHSYVKTKGWLKKDRVRLYMQKHITINSTIWKRAFIKSPSEIPLFLQSKPGYHICINATWRLTLCVNLARQVSVQTPLKMLKVFFGCDQSLNQYTMNEAGYSLYMGGPYPIRWRP